LDGKCTLAHAGRSQESESIAIYIVTMSWRSGGEQQYYAKVTCTQQLKKGKRALFFEHPQYARETCVIMALQQAKSDKHLQSGMWVGLCEASDR
jgi:hypothetical protein